MVWEEGAKRYKELSANRQRKKENLNIIMSSGQVVYLKSNPKAEVTESKVVNISEFLLRLGVNESD